MQEKENVVGTVYMLRATLTLTGILNRTSLGLDLIDSLRCQEEQEMLADKVSG